jgi:SAM-dependent methyltransferase
VTIGLLEDFFANLDLCEDKAAHTHGIHPYPAKFIPHIPRELIRHFSEPGDLVVDPMCGSGTTVLEAILAGRPAVGIDINPVSTLVTASKTTPLQPGEAQEVFDLCDRLDRAVSLPAGSPPSFRNISHWFSDDVATTLAGLLVAIDRLSSARAKRLARASLSAILVRVSMQDSETRWVRRERHVAPQDVVRFFVQRLRDNCGRAEALRTLASASAVTVNADVRRMPLESGSARLIVTSPPYANSHDYYLYNKLRLFWLGYDVRPVQDAEFGSRNKHSDQKLGIDHYLDALRAGMAEMARVLQPDGHACLVVGDAVVRGAFFDMGQEVPELGRAVGLRLRERYAFSQKRYTRAFTRGFGTKVEKRSHVLVFQR